MVWPSGIKLFGKTGSNRLAVTFAHFRLPPLKSLTQYADSVDMDPTAIALQGLQQAELQLETAATRIVKAGAASPDGATLDVVDLSTEMVALMSAQASFAANVATLKTVDQMQKSLVDLKG